jgi:hypothetical protein
MRQTTLLFVLVLLSTLTASAYDAEIGGIYYNINSTANEAEVTYRVLQFRPNQDDYVGDVNVPEKVLIYNVTSIGEQAFGYCSALTSATIPNSVTSIRNRAFQECTALTSVTFGNSVTSIGSDAFFNCSQLKEVTLPNSLTSIGSWTFYNCSSLTEVTIPNRVTSIGELSFYNCTGLTSVTIGSSVASLGSGAFWACTGLTSVTCKAKSVPSTKSDLFYNVPLSNVTLYVPESALEDYKATEPWSQFGRIEAIPYVGLRGDVNDDGVVNGTDIQAVINLIVAGEYDEKADVNEDGQVNGTDIQEVINIIVSGE